MQLTFFTILNIRLNFTKYTFHAITLKIYYEYQTTIVSINGICATDYKR